MQFKLYFFGLLLQFILARDQNGAVKEQRLLKVNTALQHALQELQSWSSEETVGDSKSRYEAAMKRKREREARGLTVAPRITTTRKPPTNPDMVIDIGQLKKGAYVLLRDNLSKVESIEYHKPNSMMGRGFFRGVFRNLITKNEITLDFVEDDWIELFDGYEIELTFLYSDGDFSYFENEETYEQVSVDNRLVENTKWLLENSKYMVTFANSNAVDVTIPSVIEAEVVDTIPPRKGMRGTKSASFSNGVEVQVPVRIKIGDKIKIDTQTGKVLSMQESNLSKSINLALKEALKAALN